MSRTTPKFVTRLNPDEIFVFGSNEAGRHGKGAALMAVRWGAKRSIANGRSGQTYAIPTKPRDLRVSLCLRDISKSVREFIEYARTHPECRFLVTEVGCGLAGYQPSDIAPMFAECACMDNVCLPQSFWEVLTNGNG